MILLRRALKETPCQIELVRDFIGRIEKRITEKERA